MTQIQRIKKHFEDGKTLTPLQALGLYGTFRLAHHVWVLREKESMPINTRIKTDENGHQYAEYYLGKVRIEDPLGYDDTTGVTNGGNLLLDEYVAEAA